MEVALTVLQTVSKFPLTGLWISWMLLDRLTAENV